MIFVLPGLFSIMILVLFIGAATLINIYKERRLLEQTEETLYEDD